MLKPSGLWCPSQLAPCVLGNLLGVNMEGRVCICLLFQQLSPSDYSFKKTSLAVTGNESVYVINSGSGQVTMHAAFTCCIFMYSSVCCSY